MLCAKFIILSQTFIATVDEEVKKLIRSIFYFDITENEII